MNKTFTVNGKSYPLMELDFNAMCEFEDRGINIDSIDAKPLKLLREYLSMVSGNTSVWAGKEIEAHVISGGDMSILYEALNEAMETSGFFRAMADRPEEEPEEVGENPKTKRVAKK